MLPPSCACQPSDRGTHLPNLASASGWSAARLPAVRDWPLQEAEDAGLPQGQAEGGLGAKFGVMQKLAVNCTLGTTGSGGERGLVTLSQGSLLHI